MLRTYGYTFLFLGWVGFITTLSLISFRGMGLDTGTLDIPHIDKFTHMVFYLVFVVLGCMFVRERSGGRIPLGRASWGITILAIVFGMVIEALQYTLTQDRMMEFLDMVSNAIGAFIGLLMVRWIFSGKKQLKWKF